MAEVLMCAGQMLAPIQGPLEAVGMAVTFPLAGGMGMSGAVGRAAAVGRTATVTDRVIGHYPQYLQVAEAVGAKAFNISPEKWAKMSDAARWTANQAFLDKGIAQGAEFVMASLRTATRAGSTLEREVGYLLENGYRWAKDGKSLIPK